VNVQQLYFECAKLIGDSFPDGMRGIDPPVPIKGLGVFPVTSGSFYSSALDAPLNRRVMFVGQDFGCEAYVMRCRKVPDTDVKSGTGAGASPTYPKIGDPYRRVLLHQCVVWRARGKDKYWTVAWMEQPGLFKAMH